MPKRTFQTILVISMLAAAVTVGAQIQPDCTPAPQYLNLIEQSEKWFVSDVPGKMVDLRYHLRIRGHFNGAVIQERELLLGDDVIETQKLLFSRTENGDIYFHGDLEDRVLAEPVLWVDAPLIPGKTWLDQTPAYDNGVNPTQVVHYVFACLEQEDVTCPTGTLTAYRVLMTRVYPDGVTTNCNFWYNERCGMLRFCQENQRVFLMNKFIAGDADDPDVELEDPLPAIGTLGAFSAPNPANPSTAIRFFLPTPSPVFLSLYDVSGKRIRTLASGQTMAAGWTSLEWDGRSETGRAVASGTYLYQVRAGDRVQNNRVVLLQ